MAYCVPLGIPHSRFLSWDPDDQDKALGYQREQRKICKGCGTRPEEWKADRNAYIGQTRYCPGCETMEQERENVPEHTRGFVHVHLAPPELAEAPVET